MTKRAPQPAQPSASRLERILGAMVISTIGLSIVCFLAVIFGTGVAKANVTEGIWPLVIAFPLVGLPIGFILIVTLIVVNMRARTRATRSSSR